MTIIEAVRRDYGQLIISQKVRIKQLEQTLQKIFDEITACHYEVTRLEEARDKAVEALKASLTTNLTTEADSVVK